MDGSGNRIGGNKVRSLTDEELRMARVAEEAVLAKLNEVTKNPQSSPSLPSAMKQPQSLKPSNPPAPAASSAFVAVKGVAEKQSPYNEMKVTVANIPPKKPSSYLDELKKNKAVVTGTTAAAAAPPKPLAQPPSAAKEIKVQGDNNKVKSQAPPSSSPASPSSSQSSASASSKEKVVLKRKLEKDELEVVGKALQLSVKHRGGGPFGSGRLQGREMAELAQALEEAFALLSEDSKLAKPSVVAEKSSKPAEAEDRTPLPSLPQQMNAAPPASRASTAIEKTSAASASAPATLSNTKSPPLAAPAPAGIAKDASEEDLALEQPMPIALGLDRFLQDSLSLSYEVRLLFPLPPFVLKI